MMSLPKAGHFDLSVDPFRADVNRQMNMGTLGNHLLNCAGFHAHDRGFDGAELDGKQYLWVLSRLVIEVYEMPQEYEKFSIETWIESIYRFFTNRNFEIFNAQGKTIGYARSVWAAIDAETRQPADLIKIYGEKMQNYVCADRKVPIDKYSHHRLQTEKPVKIWHPKYGDIDRNCHVNSMRYIDHLLDLFPLDMYRTKRVRRVEIAYVTEAHYGEPLQLFCEEESDGSYVLEIKNESLNTICSSKIVFN